MTSRSLRDVYSRTTHGFALVLVVVLIGLLVLVAYALAAIGRVESQAATAAEHRLQARQNALTALQLGVGALQLHAENDALVTAMAGVTGIPAGARQPARHWTGVWSPGSTTPAWLVSAAATARSTELTEGNSILMMGAGTLGADGAEKEHVRARWIAADGHFARGRLAWWVGDEGVKLSVASAGGDATEHALDEFFPRLDPMAPELARVRTYGQLVFVPGANITPGQLQAHAHVVGAGHRSPAPGAGGRPEAEGRLNVNSSSARYWQGIAATYNRWSPGEERLRVSTETFGERMSRGFAAAIGPGKRAGGPFENVEAVLGSDLLREALRGSGVSAAQFGDRMQGRLTTRSDTFVVRGYGAALNLAATEVIEAEVWCEAIAQRTAAGGQGQGRPFVVHSFRWLGPEDL